MLMLLRHKYLKLEEVVWEKLPEEVLKHLLKALLSIFYCLDGEEDKTWVHL